MFDLQHGGLQYSSEKMLIKHLMLLLQLQGKKVQSLILRKRKKI